MVWLNTQSSSFCIGNSTKQGGILSVCLSVCMSLCVFCVWAMLPDSNKMMMMMMMMMMMIKLTCQLLSAR